MHNKTDDELIRLFVEEQMHQAFDVLLRRHYNSSYKRLLMNVKDEEEARDLCQKLWMKVLSALDTYQYQEKFVHFLNTIATNVLKDQWRSDKAHRLDMYETHEEAVDDAFDMAALDKGLNMEDELENQRLVAKLVNELIPALPKDQRLVYLLKHEAELWDRGQPLQWQHLADLVAMSLEGVCDLFQTARDKLLKNTTYGTVSNELDDDEKSVFLVWTLSQRYDKRHKYTENYFAQLLNMPVNTLKTRYRTALKTLAEGMNT